MWGSEEVETMSKLLTISRRISSGNDSRRDVDVDILSIEKRVFEADLREPKLESYHNALYAGSK